MEAADNRRLVLWTPTDGDGSVLDRDYGAVRSMGRETTAGTVDTTRWSVMEQGSCVVGREATDGGELFEMIVTANDRDGQLIEEEE